MTATDTTFRPAARPGRPRMVSHLRRLAAAGLVEPPGAARPQQRPADGSEDAQDAEVWEDFPHRLAARLVGLHEEARTPRPPSRAVHVGATVTAFPRNRS